MKVNERIYSEVRKRAHFITNEFAPDYETRKEYWYHEGFCYIVTLKIRPKAQDRVLYIRGRYRVPFERLVKWME